MPTVSLHPLSAQAIAIGSDRARKQIDRQTLERDRRIRPPARRRRRPRRRWWHQVPRGTHAHIACTGDGHF